jgi:hypothetical protein
MFRFKIATLLLTSGLLLIWFAGAFGIWALWSKIGDRWTVKLNLAALKETKWQEYAIRFFFGSGHRGNGDDCERVWPWDWWVVFDIPGNFPRNRDIG